MKKILLLIFVVIVFFTVNTSTAFAQEEAIENTEINSTPSAIIKYDLAYPGILPDHPLYKVKVLRDKLSLGLISDAKKKIDFLLLQTDKGILAAAMLVDKNKTGQAKETALKAEHNYTLLTYELYRLRAKIEPKTFEKLKIASLKHQEVLNYLGQKVSKEDKKIFDTIVEFSKRNWETVEEFQKSEVIK